MSGPRGFVGSIPGCCEKHDLVQSGKSSMMSWPDVKLIPQTKQTNKLCAYVC